MKIFALAAGLIVPVASGMAQTFWQGGTSDYNNPASWTGAYNSGNPNTSNDSGSNNVVLIQPGDAIWFHGDTLAGNNSGNSGAYLQTGSTNNTGYPNNGNWLRMGIASGTAGYYVLSNGVANTAGRTQLGENGFGYLEVDGGVYNTGYNGNPGIVCGQGDFGPGTGVLVLNGGTINNINNETWFGEQGGSSDTGYFYMNGGTFNANNWFVFGRNGGTGYGVMTAGTINFTGGGNFLVGGGGIGSLTQSGGTINAFNSYLIPQSAGGGSGVGTNILSGSAALVVHSWLALGRGGYGEMDLSGSASVTHNDGGSHITIGGGGSSPTGEGVLNQNGGTVTELTSDVWLGEVYTAIWTLNAGTANLLNLIMSVNNGVSSTLNLNGGLMQVNEIISSSSSSLSTLNLNGGIVQAKGNNAVFINGIFQTLIGSGGAVIDSQSYNITIPEALQDNNGGAASVTKLGSGTLILSGANTFGGNMSVSNGILEVSTISSGGGAVWVTNGAGFGTIVSNLNSSLPVASLTMGGATGGSLSFNLGNFGNPGTAPLNVLGTFTASGAITVNVAASVLAAGTIPLLQYGSLAGAPTYAVGSLPAGVVAHLTTVGNTLELVVTSAGAPRWDGNVTGAWDFATNQDWFDLGTMVLTTYHDGEPVVFDDNASGTTTANLTATVAPASINFNNNARPYTIVGPGTITGITGLNVNGPGSVAVQNTGGNNFTGPVAIFNNGILNVTNLANGGSASAIGASSSNPTNLVINDGTLSYGGPTVTINRSFTIAGTNSTIDTESNLAISGNAVAVGNAIDGGSALTKFGPAQLAFTGSGDNEFSKSYQAGINVVDGTLLFDGSAGNQTNHTQNEMWIGSTVTNSAALVLTNSNLHVDNWIGLGRINGGIGNTSSITMYNSAVTCGNLSLGWDGGLPNNLASQFLTLWGNSTLTNYGAVNLPEGANSSATINLHSNSVFWVQNPFYLCLANNTTGSVVVADSAKIVSANGWFDIGQGGNCVASMLFKNNSSLAVLNGDLNVADTAGGAMGTLTVQDNATVQANTLWVGKSGNSVCSATFSNAAAANFNNYIDLASGGSSSGTLTIAGASVTDGGDMTVGDQGTAVVNMVANSGAALTVHGTLYLSRGSQTANGTVNLNAGTTIVTAYLNNGWGFQNGFSSPLDNPNAFNFNGGTLRAYVGSAFFIQPYVNAVVQAGGAVIDDNGFSIEVLTALVDGGGGGGLTKIGHGTLRLDGINTYTGSTVVSNGVLQVGSGGVIAGPVTVGSGAILAGDTGAIETYNINNTLTLSAGSTTAMSITPSSNDQIAGLTSVNYGGALVVTNNSGSPLVIGQQYTLFSAGAAGSGNFSSVTILPGGGGTFNPATGVLTITSSGPFAINKPLLSGGTLILTGTGGTSGGTYSVLTATNLAVPFPSWITNTTGVFDGTGAFSNNIPVNVSTPARFFRLKTP